MGDAEQPAEPEPSDQPPAEPIPELPGKPGDQEAGAEIVISGGGGFTEPQPPITGGGSPLAAFRDVTPEPYRRRNMLFAEAEKLADLPRHWFDDFAVAAFWGLLASAPGAYQGYADLTGKSAPTQAKFDLIEVGVFVCALTVFAVGLMGFRRRTTSRRYLVELFPETKKITGLKAWLIKQLSA